MDTWSVNQLCRAMDDLVQASIALQDGRPHRAVISLRDASDVFSRMKTEREVRAQLARASRAIDQALAALECGSIPAALGHVDAARRTVSAVVFRI